MRITRSTTLRQASASSTPAPIAPKILPLDKVPILGLGSDKHTSRVGQGLGNTIDAMAAPEMEESNLNDNPKILKPSTKKAKKVSYTSLLVVSGTSSTAKDPHHMIVSTESNCRSFLQLVTVGDSRISKLDTLEIHLNAGQFSEYYDDYLAIALHAFHPSPNSSNPHKLNCIKLVVFGNVLFTRYNYTLVSPAASYDVTSNLHKLMTGGLEVEEKANLAFAVNSTEKAFAKALLGIRGVKKVIIEHRGRAKMEAAFADIIKRTLVRPSGTKTTPSQVPSNTPGLDQTGVLLSQKLRAQSLRKERAYPLREYEVTPDPECSKTRDLVDEVTMLLGQVMNEDEEVTKISAAKAAKQGTKRKISQEDVQMMKTATATLGSGASANTRHKKRKIRSDTNSMVSGAKTGAATVPPRQPRSQGPNDKGLQDMVRIMSRVQDGEDLGMLKQHTAPVFINQQPRVRGTKNGGWLVLTGKGGMAQMGWRTE
ncbi:hypothetical protein K505DRAFT_385573 [Melanomma pulvis-pyrius CBS 109.77]|uniref:Uncharacterized protein n=1 Tax=Melanomma pulvis-pyrius CBS 109.77 TaxID=1314802 RepID=A0A6A6XUL4_9PLEO|nr:hypothetical protein K505DRAFT_385573 [Melanomma pulvis-pyrius CBS 109.77]